MLDEHRRTPTPLCRATRVAPRRPLATGLELRVGAHVVWRWALRTFDTASDWTLRWSITKPGDNDWLRRYDYECDGRWLIRDASSEPPFADAIGRDLTSAVPLFNEGDEVAGTTLLFNGLELSLQMGGQGEIDTSPGLAGAWSLRGSSLRACVTSPFSACTWRGSSSTQSRVGTAEIASRRQAWWRGGHWLWTRGLSSPTPAR